MSDTAKKCSQSPEVAEAARLARELKRARRAAELRDARTVKAAKELADWEDRTSARNPQFVRGSKRPATPAELATLKKSQVCEIVCRSCGETKVVTVQDASQSEFCVVCKKNDEKEKAKIKRAQKTSEGKSVAELEQEIARMKDLLAVKQAA